MLTVSPPKRKASNNGTKDDGVAPKEGRASAPQCDNKRGAAGEKQDSPAKKRKTGLDRRSILLPDASTGRVLRNRVINGPRSDAEETSQSVEEEECQSPPTEVPETPVVEDKAKRASPRNVKELSPAKTSNPYDSADSPARVESDHGDKGDAEYPEWHGFDDPPMEQNESEDADDEGDLGEGLGISKHLTSDTKADHLGDGEDHHVKKKAYWKTYTRDRRYFHREGSLKRRRQPLKEIRNAKYRTGTRASRDLRKFQDLLDEHVPKYRKQAEENVRRLLGPLYSIMEEMTPPTFSKGATSMPPQAKQSDASPQGEWPSSEAWRKKADDAFRASVRQHIESSKKEGGSSRNTTAHGGNPHSLPQITPQEKDSPSTNPPLREMLPLARRVDHISWYFLPAIRRAAQAMADLHAVIDEAGEISTEALRHFDADIMLALIDTPPILMLRVENVHKDWQAHRERLAERVEHQMGFLTCCRKGLLSAEVLWELEVIATRVLGLKSA